MPEIEPFRFHTRVRFIDTDTSGRIHYTAMFRYFEAAEIELLRTVGLSYSPNRLYDFPRVHVECDYIVPLRLDDLIEIRAAAIKVGRSSVRFDFETLRDGILAAKGIVTTVCVDHSSHRSVPIPGDARAKFLELARRAAAL
jgi:acyl-CoA thioester hydrolase